MSWLRRWLSNGWARAELLVTVLACGPLMLLSGLTAAGWWPDPDPNPIGLGLLFTVAVWPATIFQPV